MTQPEGHWDKVNKEKKILKKIQRLKNKLIPMVRRWHSICDSYSCGATLATHISPEATSICVDMDKVLNELALIDPATPKTRYCKEYGS